MIKHKIEVVENVTNVANINPERPYEQVVADCMKDYLEYRKLEEQGLLPKFHLGDEFWTVHYDGVTKEKIVMLQQKKDGTWKYRFPNTCDYEESDYGEYFFDTKEEAEKLRKESYGE